MQTVHGESVRGLHRVMGSLEVRMVMDGSCWVKTLSWYRDDRSGFEGPEASRGFRKAGLLVC